MGWQLDNCAGSSAHQTNQLLIGLSETPRKWDPLLLCPKFLTRALERVDVLLGQFGGERQAFLRVRASPTALPGTVMFSILLLLHALGCLGHGRPPSCCSCIEASPGETTSRPYGS